MPNRRILRINELIRAELADLLRRETEDPQLHSLISFTEVNTVGDLTLARVKVSIYGTDEEMAAIMHRLRKAARFFRRELASRLNLRHTPQLVFELDPSITRGQRVMELLSKLEIGTEDETPAGESAP
jgi:ribosome-binding factor A